MSDIAKAVTAPLKQKLNEIELETLYSGELFCAYCGELYNYVFVDGLDADEYHCPECAEKLDDTFWIDYYRALAEEEAGVRAFEEYWETATF